MRERRKQPAVRNGHAARWLRDFLLLMIANGIQGPSSIGGPDDAFICRESRCHADERSRPFAQSTLEETQAKGPFRSPAIPSV